MENDVGENTEPPSPHPFPFVVGPDTKRCWWCCFVIPIEATCCDPKEKANL
jgi:hypothetical protein